MFIRTLSRLEARPELVLDVIRVYLGVGLFVRGLALVGLDTGILELTGGSMPGISVSGAAIYVTGAHLIGGAFLTVGLYTRLAALIQLPVLIGAVFLVHWQEGLLSANQSLEFSALVLFLLLLIAVFGSSEWSLDARWRTPSSDASSRSGQPVA